MNPSLSSLYIENTSSDSTPRIALGAFDFDGNILAPNTLCYVIDIASGEEVAIPAHQLDQHPELISGPSAIYRFQDDIEDSMMHFRDFGSRNNHKGPDQLIQDVTDAIENQHFSPSFKAFKEIFLIRARLFTLITARGHSPDNLARAIQTISENTLTDEEKQIQYESIQVLYSAMYPHKPIPNRERALTFYFQEIISYYPVNNIHVAKSLGMTHIKSSAEKKTFCMNHYIADVKSRILLPLELHDTPLAIGFSDDAVSNMMAMLEYFTQRKKDVSTAQDSTHLYFSGKPGALPIPENSGVLVTEDAGMTILEL